MILRDVLRRLGDDELIFELGRASTAMHARLSFEIGRRRLRRAVDVLRGLLRSSAPDVRAAAVEALGQIGDPAVGEDVLNLLVDPHQPTEVRDTSAYALGRLRYTPATERLAAALTDPSPSVRICALAALVAIQGPEARDRIEFAAHVEMDPRVRAAMTKALAALPSVARHPILSRGTVIRQNNTGAGYILVAGATAWSPAAVPNGPAQTNIRPTGFRAPAYTHDADTTNALPSQAVG